MRPGRIDIHLAPAAQLGSVVSISLFQPLDLLPVDRRINAFAPFAENVQEFTDDSGFRVPLLHRLKAAIVAPRLSRSQRNLILESRDRFLESPVLRISLAEHMKGLGCLGRGAIAACLNE